MNRVKQLWAFFKRTPELQSIIGVSAGVLGFFLIFNWVFPTEKGPWYIGCDSLGDDARSFLIESSAKPVIRDGMIFIDGETFVTPIPMSACRVVLKDDTAVQVIGKGKII